MRWYRDYETIREHMRYHNVKKWLLDGAKQERANTIYEALERIDDNKLERRLARALARED
jgi:hypothetical protein